MRMSKAMKESALTKEGHTNGPSKGHSDDTLTATIRNWSSLLTSPEGFERLQDAFSAALGEAANSSSEEKKRTTLAIAELSISDAAKSFLKKSSNDIPLTEDAQPPTAKIVEKCLQGFNGSLKSYIKKDHQRDPCGGLQFFCSGSAVPKRYRPDVICGFKPGWNTSTQVGISEQYELGDVVCERIPTVLNSQRDTQDEFNRAADQLGAVLTKLTELQNEHIYTKATAETVALLVECQKRSGEKHGVSADAFGSAKLGIACPGSDLDLSVQTESSVTKSAQVCAFHAFIAACMEAGEAPGVVKLGDRVLGAVPLLPLTLAIKVDKDTLDQLETLCNEAEAICKSIGLQWPYRWTVNSTTNQVEVDVDVTIAPNPIAELNTRFTADQIETSFNPERIRAIFLIQKIMCAGHIDGKTGSNRTFYSSFGWRITLSSVLMDMGVFANLRGRALQELEPIMEGGINTVTYRSPPPGWVSTVHTAWDILQEWSMRLQASCFTDDSVPDEYVLFQTISTEEAELHAAYDKMLQADSQVSAAASTLDGYVDAARLEFLCKSLHDRSQARREEAQYKNIRLSAAIHILLALLGVIIPIVSVEPGTGVVASAGVALVVLAFVQLAITVCQDDGSLDMDVYDIDQVLFRIPKEQLLQEGFYNDVNLLKGVVMNTEMMAHLAQSLSSPTRAVVLWSGRSSHLEAAIVGMVVSYLHANGIQVSADRILSIFKAPDCMGSTPKLKKMLAREMAGSVVSNGNLLGTVNIIDDDVMHLAAARMGFEEVSDKSLSAWVCNADETLSSLPLAVNVELVVLQPTVPDSVLSELNSGPRQLTVIDAKEEGIELLASIIETVAKVSTVADAGDNVKVFLRGVRVSKKFMQILNRKAIPENGGSLTQVVMEADLQFASLPTANRKELEENLTDEQALHVCRSAHVMCSENKFGEDSSDPECPRQLRTMLTQALSCCVKGGQGAEVNFVKTVALTPRQMPSTDNLEIVKQLAIVMKGDMKATREFTPCLPSVKMEMVADSRQELILKL